MYDLVLQGGMIVDGTRAKPYTANVCIKDGKIAKITTETATGATVLDVTGLAVTPGFIDIHTHADLDPIRAKDAPSYLFQGVTTSLIGNCGSSILPALEENPSLHQEYCLMKKGGHPGFTSITDYAETVSQAQPGGNYAVLVGHSNLRCAVMGFVNRDPDEQEMEQLKALLERELQRGAFGMSLGLIYPPSAFCQTEELVELAKVIAKYDGILAVHMRNEGPRLFQAVQEMIDIAKASGVHIEISHLKLMGTPQWGKAPQLIAMIDEARSQGLNITCDQYPFPASSTSLNALAPHWSHDGGTPALLKRLESREGTICQEILQEMTNRGGPNAILIVDGVKDHHEYENLTIQQISENLGLDPVETVRKVLLDSNGAARGIFFSMNEEDIHYIMKQTYVCVGSDGSAQRYDSSVNLHPRNYAAFSQYFQTVREQGIHPIEDMVFKATGLTASILGITDRGTLKEGNWADIAVFDPNTFASQSTFIKPQMPPVGMHYVIVNGKLTVNNGAFTDNRAGKVLFK